MVLHATGLIPAGVHHKTRGNLLYLDEDVAVFTSSLAINVASTTTLQVEKVITPSDRSIETMVILCDPHSSLQGHELHGKKTYYAAFTSKQKVCIWNLTEQSCIVELNMKSNSLLAWNPHEFGELMILSLTSLSLLTWNIREKALIKEIFSSKNNSIVPTCFEWSHHTSGLVAIGCNSGAVFLFWRETKANKILMSKTVSSYLESAGPLPSTTPMPVVAVRWDRLSTGYLLVVYGTGHIILWDVESATEIMSFERQQTPISHICWMDWTAGNFATCSYKSDHLKVWNASQKAPIDTIRIRCDSGIHSMSFCRGKGTLIYAAVDGSVGIYDAKQRHLKCTSQPAHLDSIFTASFAPGNDGNLFATASFDGTIKIWGASNLQLQNSMESLEDVIYSIDWSPCSRAIVAASASGLVSIFDVASGVEWARYAINTAPTYGVAWNHVDAHLVASSGGDGKLTVQYVDLQHVHDQFNQQTSLGSRRKTKEGRRAKAATPKIVFQYSFSTPLFGCTWNPNNPSQLVACGHDNNLYIVDIKNSESAVQYILSGHTSRVFLAKFSPLRANLLATTSDDTTVRLWQLPSNTLSVSSSPVKISPKSTLNGHTKFSRSICWNYEHSQILLTGSWDSTIRVWNIDTEECIHILRDHCADVYAIESHPSRPFSYISSSRDSTLRVWEVSGIFRVMRSQCVWNASLKTLVSPSEEDNKISFVSSDTDSPHVSLRTRESNLGSTTALEWKFNGETSRLLHSRAEELISKYASQNTLPIIYDSPVMQAQFYLELFSFFCGLNGSLDLWENIVHQLAKIEGIDLSTLRSFRPVSHRRVVSEDELLLAPQTEIKKLMSNKTVTARKFEPGSRAEDILLNAAMINARLGRLDKYCSIMVDLGRWEAALALAPAVSIEYWQELMMEYTIMKMKAGSEQAIPPLVALGKDAQAVDFYFKRGELEPALQIAKMSEMRKDLVPDLTLLTSLDAVSPQKGSLRVAPRNQFSAAINSLHADVTTSTPQTRSRTVGELEESRLIIRRIADAASFQYRLDAQPILAAAQMIAVSEPDAALQILVQNFEFDSALALAICYRLPNKQILTQWAVYLASLSASGLTLALEILATLPTRELELGLLTARYISIVDHVKIETRYQLPSRSHWLHMAKQEADIGSDCDAGVHYLLAHDFENTVQIGIQALRRSLLDPWELGPETRRLFGILKFVPAEELSPSALLSFLSNMLWFGAHEAVTNGILNTAVNMLSVLLGALRNEANAQEIFPVPVIIIQTQYVLFAIFSRHWKMEQLLLDLVSAHSDPEVLSPLQMLLSLFFGETKFWGRWCEIIQCCEKGEDPYLLLTENFEDVIVAIGTISQAIKLPTVGNSVSHRRQRNISPSASIIQLLRSSPSCLLGSKLPGAQHSSVKSTSMFSSHHITGSFVLLEDGKSVLSQNEAAEWLRILPYSPLLTGKLL